MSPADRQGRRADAQRRAAADLERWSQRRDRGLWRSLALVGSVGWPIALLTVGGALAGRLLDDRFDTGVHFTLGLLVLGATAGAAIAAHAIRGDER